MNFFDISLLVLGGILVIYRGWMGVREGASSQIRYALAILFGMLVAIRYWQPVTEQLTAAVTFDPRWVALTAFVALFLCGTLVAGLVVNLKAQAFKSVKPNYLDHVLGLLVGLFSGGLLGASLLWLFTIAVPGAFSSTPEAQQVIGFPRQIFQGVETVMGVAPDSAARTRYPEVTMVDAVVTGGKAADLPPGAVLMQSRGQIVWK